jgi:tetratricopeptide (TPR) repeat protein
MAGGEHPPDGAVRLLEAELRRHPEDRYPVQHATARFHLGTVSLDEGRPGEAIVSLRTAVRLFADLPVERAKAVNMLGVALRTAGSPADAAEAFADAERTFGAAQQPLEQAAATYNLGLAALDQGEAEVASQSFRRARDRFAEERAPAQTSAAGRELAAVLLAQGRLDDAVEAAEEASVQAEHAGDLAAIGGAANVLGLAQLARGRGEEAATAFQVAAGANPRGLRPEGYAMAKANLALAHEALTDGPRARQSARQARDTPGAPTAARDHALAVLHRLPDASDDLVAVLDQEPVERWPAVVREEMLRWLDRPPGEQQEAAAALVHGQLGRGRHSVDLADAWMGVLLELPPDTMERFIHLVVGAVGTCDEHDGERFRNEVARTMAHFGVPQLLRLRDAFQAAADRLGQDGSWS